MALNAIGLGFIFTSKEFVSKDLRGMANGLSGLEKAVAKFAGSTKIQMRNARGEFIGVREELSATGKQIVSGLKQMAVGLGIFKIGITGLKAFKPALDDARDFGKAIDEVSTLVDTATFPVATMKDLTKELAAEFGADALQQAPALYQAISAGASDVSSATDLMRSANKLAIGGVTDLTTSVDVLSTATNVYEAAGLSAADASDTLFVAIRAGKTTAGELGAALGRVLPIASSLGISFQEVNAAAAAMTAGGLNTRAAVTGMNAALANVIKPSKAAKREAKRLGIEFNAAALRSKGLKGFLDQVTGSSKFNADSLSRLFGSVQGLNAITSLTSNSSKKFNSVLDEMAGRTGATDAAFNKMSGGLDFQMKRLDALKKNLRITVGEAIAPFVGFFVRGLSAIVGGFNALPGPVQKAIVLFAALTLGLVAATGAFIAMRGAILLMGPAFRLMLRAAIPALVAMGPFILIAAAIIVTLALLKKAFDTNFGGFGDEMRALFAEIKPDLVELKAAMLDAFRSMLDAIRPLFPVLRMLARFFVKVLVVAIKIFAFSVKIMAKVFRVVIKGMTFAIRALVAVFQFLGAVAEAIGRGISRALARPKRASQVLGQVAMEIGEAFIRMGSAVKRAWNSVAEFLKPITDAMIKIFEKISSLIDDVVGAAKGAQKFVSGVAGKFTGGITLKRPVNDNSFVRNTESIQLAREQKSGGPPTPVARDLLQPVAAPAGAQGPARAEKITLVANINMDGDRIETRISEIQSERTARRNE